ncbi:cytochrome P450 [Nocardiopsis alba]|uniref:cytochrome P450 n=1 Tax=Nocardiopsis alba TaxID=53437 RepID=UPI0036728869
MAEPPGRSACPVSLPIERERALDPPARYALLRERSPITGLAFPDGTRGWLVTGHAPAREVLLDDRFSARQDIRAMPAGRRPSPPAAPGFFVRMDAPEHTRYRRRLAGWFTRRRVREMEPRIEGIARECAGAMRERGAPADLVADYALPLPSLVICELLGVPYADRGRFQHDTGVAFDVGASPERVDAAISDLNGYLVELVERRRREPDGGLLSGLLSEGDLDDREIVSMAFLLVVAGHETTAGMLGLGAFALLSAPDPDPWKEVWKEEASGRAAVEELLRYLTVMQFGAMRVAREDLDLRGERIGAGEAVVVSLAAADRDPEVFPEPDRLDPGRDASTHLAFGAGPHHCLGHQLARSELRIGLGTLFEEFPDLRPAVPPERVRMRTTSAVYGVHALPVTWGG